MTQTKSRNKFKSFRIMAIINIMWSWSHEMKNIFLNINKLSELRIPGSSIFHIDIVEGKKEFFKKYVLH